MTKQEVALRVTIKAMELNPKFVGVYEANNRDIDIDDNINRLANFFNGIYEKLSDIGDDD